jgi:DNA-directed RNA polymerase specialized sigma24 family protein
MARPPDDSSSDTGFHDELARIAFDPEIVRIATRRAGSRELAEDAIQETLRSIAERQGPAIKNLRAFFHVALRHEINHQLGRPQAIPVEDIGVLSESEYLESPSIRGHGDSTEAQIALRGLRDAVLARLDSARGLDALVPARSPDPARYQIAIVSSARILLELLLEGYVSAADWNAVLKAAYPQWCDEPGLVRDATDQRLSRARRDVQSLLRAVISRDELTS